MSTWNPFASQIASASASTGVPANVLTSLIQTESSFDPYAESDAGAQGLTQLMPGTAASLGVTNPFDAGQSISGGATYLAAQIKRFGSTFLGLEAYNEGPTALANQLSSGQQIPSSVQSYANNVLSGASSPSSGSTLAQQVAQMASGNTNPSGLPTGAASVAAISGSSLLQSLAESWKNLTAVNLITVIVGGLLFSFGLLSLVVQSGFAAANAGVTKVNKVVNSPVGRVAQKLI